MSEAKEHGQWLLERRKELEEIIDQAGDWDQEFSWSGLDYSGRPTGMVIHYKTGRDLTAAVIVAWLNHRSGDTPNFRLDELMKAMGELWDREVAGIVWDEWRMG